MSGTVVGTWDQKEGIPALLSSESCQRHFDTCQSKNIYASLGKSSCDICYYIYIHTRTCIYMCVCVCVCVCVYIMLLEHLRGAFILSGNSEECS